MKLCVLGPVNTVSRNARIVRDAFPELEVQEVAYELYTDTLGMIGQIQRDFDLLLFPGKAAYRLCEKHTVPTIPWEYIPRHSSSLLRALLEVQYAYKKDIRRISYDTLDYELILQAYQEIGIDRQDLRIFVAEQRLLDPDYLQYLVEFHKHNYYSQGASFCITGLTEIKGMLQQLQIPCVITLPIRSVIVDTVKKLQLRHMAQLNSESWIVVISVELVFSGEYSVMSKDDYAYILNRIKVLECIYQFNYRIDGVVVESSDRTFLIFSTRKSIELETEHFKSLYLLDLLDTCHAENIAVGIGYGSTANDARFHALSAMEMAKKQGSNCAYVILEDGAVLSPLLPHRMREDRAEKLDGNLAQLARQTGLSVNTLHTILLKTQKSGHTEFTSRQLASLCDLNIRTMDRILQKLLAVGCCEVVGTHIVGNHGRPSRIFRFRWSEWL